MVRKPTKSRRPPVAPEYMSWQSMKGRCLNPKDDAYQDYGGRGITIHMAWRRSFQAFLADMGPRPKGTTLDRYPDNDGNYEPGNCRWATLSEQNKNTRRARRLTFNGETLSLVDWEKRVGVDAMTIERRQRAGQTPEQCLRPADSKSRGGQKLPVITFRGETLTMNALADRLGMDARTLKERLSWGLSIEECCRPGLRKKRGVARLRAAGEGYRK